MVSEILKMQTSLSSVSQNPTSGRVLVVDPITNHLATAAKYLRDSGIEEIFEASDGKVAEQMIKTQRPDVAVIDIKMPGGMQFLRSAIRLTPPLPVVIFTSYSTIRQATRAMRLGAVDYVVKPVDVNDLITAVHRAVERKRMLDPARGGWTEEGAGFGELLGTSDVMMGVFDQIRRAAPFNSTVLITGESGTGKELVASAIHSLSAVGTGPFVAVNCSTLQADLAESELFGHAKGAFTGATGTHLGLFEAAHQGTLFLDEIGDLEMRVQTKLLRVLEEKKIRRLGSRQSIDINVRIVAASNTDLAKAVKSGRFRSDLYYRLNVIHLSVPPLRERKADIPLLVRTFVERFSEQNGIPPVNIADRCLDQIAEYDWPGNVRELKNAAERLMIYAAGSRSEISEKTIETILPSNTLRTDPSESQWERMNYLPRQLSDVEREAILDTLAHTGGNRTQTAELLGISLRTLQRKLVQYEAASKKTSGH